MYFTDFYDQDGLENCFFIHPPLSGQKEPFEASARHSKNPRGSAQHLANNDERQRCGSQ